jgi:hypothetical protein
MRYIYNEPSGTIVAGGNGSGIATTQLFYPYAVYFDSYSNTLFIANSFANNIYVKSLHHYFSTVNSIYMLQIHAIIEFKNFYVTNKI